MKHKLYKAIETLVNAGKLNGEIKMNFSYFKINLKGTKPDNMSRFSKKRNKSDKHQGVKGVSYQKVCVLTAIDSNDNCIAKITGLGSESVEKLSKCKDFFSQGSVIVSDSKSSNTKFARTINCKTRLVPSGKHLTKDGNNINDINQPHQELKIVAFLQDTCRTI